MAESVRKWFAEDAFFTMLMTLYGLGALLFAATGTYTLVASSVRLRTHEIGVRVSLGARRRAILLMVVGHGAVLAGIGIALGLGLALPLSCAIRSRLYVVSPFDALTYAGVTALFTAMVTVQGVSPWFSDSTRRYYETPRLVPGFSMNKMSGIQQKRLAV